MFCILKKNKTCLAYILKTNSSCGNRIILLMIPNEEKEVWYYLTTKTVCNVRGCSSLLKQTVFIARYCQQTLKDHENFYCLNCFHSFATKNKLESHEKVCKEKFFCGTALPARKKTIYSIFEIKYNPLYYLC